MAAEVKEIVINGVPYIPRDSAAPPETLDGMEFVLVRTHSAGVHAGYLQSREGKEVVLRKAIRIHYWDGAASCSQLAVDGVSKPESCRFAQPVDKITLTEAIEIIPCTGKAEDNIQRVKTWKV